MDVGDPVPSHLHDLSVLGKAKHEQSSRDVFDKDPLTSVLHMKYASPYYGSLLLMPLVP